MDKITNSELTARKAEIQADFEATGQRLTELTAMRDDLDENIKTLQTGFIAGTMSVETLLNEQLKLTTLNASVDSLQLKQTELQTALDTAAKAETRAFKIEQAKAIANEAESVYQSYLQIRQELHDALCTLSEKLFISSRKMLDKTFEFKTTINGIEPLIAKEELELPPEMLALVAGSGRVLPALEFDDVIRGVEDRLAFTPPKPDKSDGEAGALEEIQPAFEVEQTALAVSQ